MMSKEKIWAFYAVLIVVFGVIGYFIGKKQFKPELYASFGVLIGAVLCVILWVTVGKKMSEQISY